LASSRIFGNFSLKKRFRDGIQTLAGLAASSIANPH
jgi:hypothetical protein